MYFIIETHKNADGTANIETPVPKVKFTSACSYYHERLSKMCATTLYTSASVALADENLNIIEQKTVETSYVAPAAE